MDVQNFIILNWLVNNKLVLCLLCYMNDQKLLFANVAFIFCLVLIVFAPPFLSQWWEVVIITCLKLTVKRRRKRRRKKMKNHPKDQPSWWVNRCWSAEENRFTFCGVKLTFNLLSWHMCVVFCIVFDPSDLYGSFSVTPQCYQRFKLSKICCLVQMLILIWTKSISFW